MSFRSSTSSSCFTKFVGIFPVETVPAMTAAKIHLINIPLIYWEDLAGLRPAGPINKAAPLFR
jgi:hypothetical protein